MRVIDHYQLDSCTYSERLLGKIALLNTKVNNSLDIVKIKQAIFMLRNIMACKTESLENFITLTQLR